ncbi:hypothetical protein ABMA58_21025, partial [Oceanospirillum sp. HFRX-1_2]
PVGGVTVLGYSAADAAAEPQGFCKPRIVPEKQSGIQRWVDFVRKACKYLRAYLNIYRDLKWRLKEIWFI